MDDINLKTRRERDVDAQRACSEEKPPSRRYSLIDLSARELNDDEPRPR